MSDMAYYYSIKGYKVPVFPKAVWADEVVSVEDLEMREERGRADAQAKSADDLANLCEKIAEALEICGHHKGSMLAPDGSMCLLGAGRFVQQTNISMGGFHKPDYITARALRIDHPAEVVHLNDKRLGPNPMDKEAAIDLCISAAKFWRNQ